MVGEGGWVSGGWWVGCVGCLCVWVVGGGWWVAGGRAGGRAGGWVGALVGGWVDEWVDGWVGGGCRCHGEDCRTHL